MRKYIYISLLLMLYSCMGLDWEEIIEIYHPEDTHPRVILISVDGLRARAIKENIDRLPTFKYLQNNGKYSYEARADKYITETLPNHVGMVTGRFGRGDDAHEWTNNGDPGQRGVKESIVSIFDRVDNDLLLVGKPKIEVLFKNSFNISRVERHTQRENTRILIENIEAYDFMMIHYLKPDSIGHKTSFFSDAYFNAVKEVDGYIGQIINTLPDNTILILTSDHGGGSPIPNQHYSQNDATNYTIPLFIYGYGVASGQFNEINGGHIYSMHVCNFILEQLGESIISEGLQGLKIE